MALARTIWGTLKESRRLTPLIWNRTMVIEIEKFKDKETAEEAVYMSKQDEKLLRNLLKKVKIQADATDKHHAVGESAAELSALKEILGKYNVSAEDLQAVIKWKYST